MLSPSYKVLFISSWFPSEVEPTNGNFVQRHAEAVALYHQVEVLHCVGNTKQQQAFRIEEQKVNNVRIVWVYYKPARNPFLRFFQKMNAYIKGFRKMQLPDIVHANVLNINLLFAVWLKKKKGIPFVVSEHWSAYQWQSPNKRKWWWNVLAKYIANKADYILPVSENLARGLQSLGIQRPMLCVPNVVNTQLFVPQKRNSDIFTFLHVSNLGYVKNADKIVDTVEQLHAKGYQFILKIGGDATEQMLQYLRERAKGKPYISVFACQTPAEVAHLMAQAHCFVLFSKTENQPCVILESLSAGTPVIATRVGGIADVLLPSYGRLVERDNTEQLLQAMEAMMKADNFSASTLHAYADTHFSKEKVGLQFTHIYQKVLNAKVGVS